MEKRINLYVCPDNHQTITINKDHGVTPMFITCEVCNKMARSNFYRVELGLKPTHEWYKPDQREFKKLSIGEKDHVESGGLLLRKIK